MVRFRLWRHCDEAGFSLVELLVVSTIVIILSILAMPVYANALDKARTARSISDLNVIEQALVRYYSENAHYPSNLQVLVSRGYIKPQFTFQSPWGTKSQPRYYFYVVDQAGDDRAVSYGLGDPGPKANCARTNDPNGYITLHSDWEGNPLPCGLPPGGTGFALQNPDDLETVRLVHLHGENWISQLTPLEGLRPDLLTRQ